MSGSVPVPAVQQPLNLHFCALAKMGLLTLTVFLVSVARAYCNYGDPFGLISRVQTFCELNALTTASKLSDTYNSLDESTRKSDRMKQEYIMEHTGFGWTNAAGLMHGSLLDTSASTAVDSLQKKGGWIGGDQVAPAYKAVENQWIYFYGDHTLRQIASAFLHPNHGKDPSKEWTHNKCTSQEGHRNSGDHHAAPDAPAVGAAENNNHATHNYKAKTCHFPGFGAMGKITYDWKHTPLDEYDQWMFGTEGIWSASAPADGAAGDRRVPDVLVVQIGYSTCLPSFDAEKSATELQHGEDEFNTHVQQVDALLDAIKAAVARPQSASSSSPAGDTPAHPTTVIVSTAPRSAVGNSKASFCTWKLNRIIARAAHNRGFIVFEREEMEHRIAFKSEYSEDLLQIGAVDAAPAPVSSFVSTALLSMMNCLARNESEPPSV